MFFLEQKRLTLVYPDTGFSGYLALCLHRAETSGTALSGTLVCPANFKEALGSSLNRTSGTASLSEHWFVRTA